MAFASNWSLLGEVLTRLVNWFWSSRTKGGHLNVFCLIRKTRDSLKTFLMTWAGKGTLVPLHKTPLQSTAFELICSLTKHKFWLPYWVCRRKPSLMCSQSVPLLFRIFLCPCWSSVRSWKQAKNNKTNPQWIERNKQRTDRHWIKRTGSWGIAKWEIWAFGAKERLRSFLGRVQHHLDFASASGLPAQRSRKKR